MEVTTESRDGRKNLVLFLCSGNSCRSQIAEAWTRLLKSDALEAFSAGTEPRGLDVRAVTVMAEVGIDITGQSSKHLDQLGHLSFDYVVTLCSEAQENCPFFPARIGLVHVGFDDPPKLAENASTEEEALNHYRRVRDQIRSFVDGLPDNINSLSGK